MLLKKFFHPKNGKIHPKYNQFIKWGAASTFLISAETVLATHSMLSAVTAATSELAVSTNYIGKDIFGQIGGMFLINKFGHFSDSKPMKFIKTNMAVQQIATVVECATPLFPQMSFIPLAGSANVLKNLTFISFGSINAKVIKELSVNGDNMGEIYAKIGAINTLASTLGMGFGLALAGAIPSHTLRLCIVPILGGVRYITYQKSIEGLFFKTK